MDWKTNRGGGEREREIRSQSLLSCLYTDPINAIHLATTNAHATVVQLEFLQGETSRALQQRFKSTHPIWPKGIVTQIQHCKLAACRNNGLPERDLQDSQRVTSDKVLFQERNLFHSS